MEEYVAYPPRRLGLIIQMAITLLLIAVAAGGLWKAAQASIGLVFLLYMLPAFFAVGIIPVLAYRAYALQNAYYILERNGIRLRWGLRSEDIPMTSVLWVLPAAELKSSLPLPWLRWPGAVLGHRHLQDGGELEYLASNTKGLVIIAATPHSFAISPANPEAFMGAFQRFTEMGSLSPLAARSVFPTFLLARVWASRPARLLLLASLALSLALLVWVSLAIPSQERIYLGFRPDGALGDAVPSVRLMLLPIINIAFVLLDIFLGLFLFRREESQPFSYLLWGSGALTPVLFLAAVFFILQAS